MTTGAIHDQKLEKHIEKQMGCMAGFFQLFDRHQILSGKGLHARKRLTSAAASDYPAEISRELEKPNQTRATTLPSPDRLKSSPATDIRSSAEIPATLPLPLPIFECKDGTKSLRKFCKEAPRLSLDSRAIVDAKGKIRINPVVLSSNRSDDSGHGVAAAADGDENRRSPSVIAKLMGLEPLPNSSPEPTKNAELRRSSSESRVSRDLFPYRYLEGNTFQLKEPGQFHSVVRDNAVRENTTAATLNCRPADPINSGPPKPSLRGVCPLPRKSQQQRKSCFDTADFFPEPKRTVSIYGEEIEKRLKMRGIDDPSKDLDTLKQILEALQLKGLLHSRKVSEQINHRNFVYERRLSDEYPIVIMKPSSSAVAYQRFGSDSPPNNFRNRGGVLRNLKNSGEKLSSTSPRQERHSIEARSKNSSSPIRRESKAETPNSSQARRRSLSIETRKKASESSEYRKASPVHSPRPSPKRNGSDQNITARLPRNSKSTAEIKPMEKISSADRVEDESSSISESSVSTSSITDRELQRLKIEACKGGKGLLERCDKLLNSIIEMTTSELQPSPVSVLDSSFYKDESSSPSPVLKRNIEFKEFEEEIWSPAISPLRTKHEYESEDSDFIYISDILRASNYLPEDTNIFLLLEKQQYQKGQDNSKESKLQRKLIFDIITEILDRNRNLPPWKLISRSISSIEKPSLHQIWSEFQTLRELDTSEDLFEIICGVLWKDLAGDGINGWGDSTAGMSEAVLDIERLIFKDLICETIRHLPAFAPPRRKLFFSC